MDPEGAPRRSSEVERLAEALGVPPHRVADALAAAGLSGGDLGRSGDVSEERVAAAARALRVDTSVLRAAILDLAAGSGPLAARAATAADAATAAIRGTAEEALAIGLEVVGESIPRLLNNLLAGLAAAGVALVAVGLLAILQTELFVRLLAFIAGLALIVAGGAFFLLAWKLHEATAALRTLARIAKRWRARHASPAPEHQA